MKDSDRLRAFADLLDEQSAGKRLEFRNIHGQWVSEALLIEKITRPQYKGLPTRWRVKPEPRVGRILCEEESLTLGETVSYPAVELTPEVRAALEKAGVEIDE